jgi:hypothetical protein
MPLLQEFVALAVVAAAAAYLAYRGWLVLARKRSGGCGGGGCSTCPGGEQKGAKQQGFVPIEQLVDRNRGPQA